MTIENEFANTEYLADPAWLQAHRNDPDLVIVDLDAEAGYLRGHIPGALFLDNNYERNPETGWVNTMPPDRFAAVCQALGIGDDTLVVACDNNMSLHAARFWWTLATTATAASGCWTAAGGAGLPRAAPSPSTALLPAPGRCLRRRLTHP